jgi:hypothetical protein
MATDYNNDAEAQRLEDAIGDLIEEGASFHDPHAFLRAAVERAGLK